MGTVSDIRFERAVIGTLGAPLRDGESAAASNFSSREGDEEDVGETDCVPEKPEVSADPLAHGLGLRSTEVQG